MPHGLNKKRQAKNKEKNVAVAADPVQGGRAHGEN